MEENTKPSEILIVLPSDVYPEELTGLEKYFSSERTTTGLATTHFVGSAKASQFNEQTIVDLEALGATVYQDEPFSTVQADYNFIGNINVYATQSGTQYHREDCHYVAGKANLRVFDTIQQAIDAGLSNCDSCLG